MGRDDAITRQAAFFASVRTQKLPTLRWSLRHGGCRLDLRDEDENTPIMIASAENKLKALLELCDYARHNDLLYTMNLVDSDGMYAVAGWVGILQGFTQIKASRNADWEVDVYENGEHAGSRCVCECV